MIKQTLIKIPWLIAASISSEGSFSMLDGSDAMSATCSKSSFGIFNISATNNCFSIKACLIISSFLLRHSENLEKIMTSLMKYLLYQPLN